MDDDPLRFIIGDLLAYNECECNNVFYHNVRFKITHYESSGDSGSYQCKLIDPVRDLFPAGHLYWEGNFVCSCPGSSTAYRIHYALEVPQLNSVEEAQAWLASHSA